MAGAYAAPSTTQPYIYQLQNNHYNAIKSYVKLIRKEYVWRACGLRHAAWSTRASPFCGKLHDGASARSDLDPGCDGSFGAIMSSEMPSETDSSRGAQHSDAEIVDTAETMSDHERQKHERWREGARKRAQNPTTREKLREQTRASWDQPEVRAKRLAGLRGITRDLEGRQKRSEGMRAAWNDPVKGQRLRAGHAQHKIKDRDQYAAHHREAWTSDKRAAQAELTRRRKAEAKAQRIEREAQQHARKQLLTVFAARIRQALEMALGAIGALNDELGPLHRELREQSMRARELALSLDIRANRDRWEASIAAVRPRLRTNLQALTDIIPRYRALAARYLQAWEHFLAIGEAWGCDLSELYGTRRPVRQTYAEVSLPVHAALTMADYLETQVIPSARRALDLDAIYLRKEWRARQAEWQEVMLTSTAG